MVWCINSRGTKVVQRNNSSPRLTCFPTKAEADQALLVLTAQPVILVNPPQFTAVQPTYDPILSGLLFGVWLVGFGLGFGVKLIRKVGE